MELRNFFEIFIIQRRIFFLTVLLVFICGTIFYIMQPQTYKATLVVNITRDAPRETNEYAYDHFYRLQADERFADTVVQWITSPLIHTHIPDARRVTAKRLSSQVIKITYVTDTADAASAISQKLIAQLNMQSQKINNLQREGQWFMVQGEKPLVQDNTLSVRFLLLLCITLGVFLGFWAVVIRHYMIGGIVK